jgi:hypothetical protein
MNLPDSWFVPDTCTEIAGEPRSGENYCAVDNLVAGGNSLERFGDRRGEDGSDRLSDLPSSTIVHSANASLCGNMNHS